MRDNRSGKHAEVRACALEQAFGRHVSLGQRERRTGTFDAVDSFNRRASTVTASMSASQSENTRSESHTGNRINGTKGYTIRDGSRDRVPFSECFVPIVVVAMLSRCRGAKLHASALMLAFGGMRGIPRSEAQRGCRGARVRVRSWSRHGRVGWWSQVGARPVRVYVAGKRHGGLPREPNDWLRNAEARGCVGRGRGARGIR